MSETPLRLVGWPRHWLEYFKRSLENTRPFPERNRPKEDWRHKRKCSCGCGGKTSHTGFVNGLAMMSGCELRVRRWVNG